MTDADSGRLSRLEVCYLEDFPLPLGEGGAAAPGQGSPLHDYANRRNRGAGCPHPALCATFCQREKD